MSEILLLPPHDEQVEKMLLGSMLIDTDVLSDIGTMVEERDFYFDRHQKIFSAMKDAYREFASTDIVSVSNKLSSSNKLLEAGGRSYLMEITNCVPTAKNAKIYAKIIRDKSIRRKMMEISEMNKWVALNETTDIEQAVFKYQNNAFSINYDMGDDGSSVAKIVGELTDRQEKYGEKFKNGETLLGIGTGFSDVDLVSDGMQEGQIWFVAAWTNTGKTMYVLNIMNHILPRGIPATVISLEMSRVQILSRMIGMEMGISATNVLKAYADESSMTDIEMKKGVFSEYPLTVHDRHFTLQSIKSILRKEKIKNKMRVAVIDFVQNISSEESKTEYTVLTESVRDLQELAKELGITIICVSQLNNASVDSRGGKVASGMKGTGAAEYVADMVIKLERNREKESILDEDDVPIRMIIHKNRNGAAGAVGNYVLHRHSGKIEKSTVVDDGDSADDGYVLPPEKKLKGMEWEN